METLSVMIASKFERELRKDSKFLSESEIVKIVEYKMERFADFLFEQFKDFEESV